MPDPKKFHPIYGYDKLIYEKPKKTNPNNIIVSEFTYTWLKVWKTCYPLPRMEDDRLIIDKFYQIATDVEFYEWSKSSNECCANISILYFEYNMKPPADSDLPISGYKIIGNDVWFGQNAAILPGVHIGDGAIIGTNCVVCGNVELYTIIIEA